ncbi:hypothetical protein [Streptomyces sp. Ag109_G2-15]|uniref:hypothetical protein n=1 Tax=Streptomyces sp. Ag109_G2-15 TaxID=1938850 RepID=UPI00117C7FD4|nr:hypothetical protein [Streptomyces sp. Ag109_G2-15]
MRTLSRFGELAWFKLPVEYNPVHGYHQVPYMGWRYTSPQEDIAQLIEDAVEGLPTQVEWTLDRSRRNWILLPSRILREAQGLENPAFANIVHSINVQDQEFCLKALSDFDLIILHLQQIPIPKS